MTLHIGDTAPDFSADTQIGPTSDAEADGLFPQGWTEHRPYLRTTMVE